MFVKLRGMAALTLLVPPTMEPAGAKGSGVLKFAGGRWSNESAKVCWSRK
jgi:hypothetical protein